jgi:hypothetical protein
MPDALALTAARIVVVVHFLFVLFVGLGGFAVLWRTWMVWLHVPAAVWGALISFAGWICPLTPLEIRLRRMAGEEAYTSGFIEEYLLPALYPSGLTRDLQLALGIGVIVVNVVIYSLVWRRRRVRAGSS